MTDYKDQMRKYFASNNRTKEYQSHQSKVHTIGWNCDGKKLASGSTDKSVCVYNLERDRLVKGHVFRGHNDGVDQLVWNPKSAEQLASASTDKTVRVWDARTDKAVATVTTRGENINIVWSPDGRTIAVGNKEDEITFIDYRKLEAKLFSYKVEVNEITWNKTGDLFFMTTGQGTVQVHSYPDMKLLHTINAHPTSCICIEFEPHGHHFAVGSSDALVSLWDSYDLICLRTFSRLDWQVRTISFNHDGKLLASASEDLFIDIAEVATGDEVAQVKTEAPTFSLAWHPKKPLLAFSCDDKDKYDSHRDAGSIRLWGLPSDEKDRAER